MLNFISLSDELYSFLYPESKFIESYSFASAITNAFSKTQSEYEEWVKLGKGKWLRAFLKEKVKKRKD
jgi:hypothetical protein